MESKVETLKQITFFVGKPYEKVKETKTPNKKQL